MSESTNTIDASVTDYQDGVLVVVTDSWTDPGGQTGDLNVGSISGVITANPAWVIGLRIPAVQTGAADKPNQSIWVSGSLTLRHSTQALGAALIVVDLLIDPFAPAWSNTFKPDGASALTRTTQTDGGNSLLLDSMGKQRTYAQVGAVLLGPAADESDLVLTLDLVADEVLSLTMDSNWSGFFNIEIRGAHTVDANGRRFHEFTGANQAVAPRLSWTYDDTLFRALSGPWQAMGRADECPICGRKSTRDTWVFSEWHKRMVCPECFDPVDPLEHRREIETEDPLGLGEDT